MNQPPADDGSDVPQSPNGDEAVPPAADPVISSDPSFVELSASPRKRPGFFVRVAQHLSWTDSQRRGLLVALTLVLGVLIFRSIRDRAFVPDPQSPEGVRAAELTSRIDPNTASLEELIALPQLGEKRAKAIIEYRERWQKYHPDEPAFAEPLDMVKVTGIGAAMKDNLAPYLSFPPGTAKAATQSTIKPPRLPTTRTTRKK